MCKKSIGRILSLLLVLVLVFTAAAGCGKKTETTDQTTEAKTTEKATTETTAATEPSTEPTEEKVDLGGYEFVLGSHWLTEYFPEEGQATELQDKLAQRFKEIEEKYNCKIVGKGTSPEEYVPGVTAAVMAGDKYADIIDSNWGWFQSLRSGGYLAALNEVPGFDVNDPKWTKIFTEFGTHDGKVYGVNHSNHGRAPELRGTLHFNKSLLEREGQPNLYELVKNNQWTWDKFLEIAKACTKDKDGDGNNDIFGMTTIGGTGLEYPLIWANGGSIVKYEGGKFRYSLSDPDAQEALQFAHDLINVHKVFKFPKEGGDWTQPAMEFMEGNIAFFPMEFWAAAVWFKDMKDDFGIIPMPKGPKGTDYVSLFSDARLYSMTTSNKDKDKAAIIWNAITEPLEGLTSDSWKQEYRDNIFRDDDSLAMYELLLSKGSLDRSVGINGDAAGAVTTAITKVTRDKSDTPAAATTAIANQVQAAVDEFYKAK